MTICPLSATGARRGSLLEEGDLRVDRDEDRLDGGELRDVREPERPITPPAIAELHACHLGDVEAGSELRLRVWFELAADRDRTVVRYPLDVDDSEDPREGVLRARQVMEDVDVAAGFERDRIAGFAV